MYQPPPGYLDLLGDAELYAPTGTFLDLDVPQVGTVSAQRPRAWATGMIAMSANPEVAGVDRTGYQIQFVETHIGSDEMERIYFEMMTDQLPSDAIDKVARALSVWGTARPYTAVITLATMTGYHWRTLRQKLLAGGVTRPLALDTVHALLDFTESVIVEAILNGEDADRELASFRRGLYGPSPEDRDVVPAGFSPEEVEASFDAFARAAR